MRGILSTHLINRLLGHGIRFKVGNPRAIFEKLFLKKGSW